MIFSCTGCEGWDRTPQTHIHPNTDPHHLWPRWLWFTRVCFRLDRLYSKIHRVTMMLLLSVTWICHGSAGTPKSIWKKLTMTTMYWWFLVDIWSQIPSIHHKTVHIFQVLQDGILVPVYFTYNHLFNLVIQCSSTWSTKICFVPSNVLITKVVKQKTTHTFIISCLSIKITYGSQGQTNKDKTPSW